MRKPLLVPTDAPLDPLTLGAGTWLACGAVVAGLTPLPIHDAANGWSAAFWLLAAPLVVLLARPLTHVQALRGHHANVRPRLHPALRTRGPARRHAATPRRLASIRRNSSCMMRR